MNIIELFENAGIYIENRKEFTFEDNIKVKQQFDIARNANQDINANLADNLIAAINEFPSELLFLSNNRRLYNFFSKKNYSRNRFNSDNVPSVSSDRIKAFIEKFLIEDLNSFFQQKIDQNNFEDINDFLSIKEYLPQSSLDKLSQLVTDKLSFVLNKLDGNFSVAGDDFMKVYFIKFGNFYSLLSEFRSEENDQKIKALYDKITGQSLKPDVKRSFSSEGVVAMANYNAVDDKLNSVLKNNKERIVAAAEKEYAKNDSSGMSTWSIIAIIIVVIRLIMLMVRLAR
jgi:hypothetical protein